MLFWREHAASEKPALTARSSNMKVEWRRGALMSSLAFRLVFALKAASSRVGCTMAQAVGDVLRLGRGHRCKPHDDLKDLKFRWGAIREVQGFIEHNSV